MMLKLMQTRTVVLIGVLSLAAGWLLHGSPASQSAEGPSGNAGAATRRGPRPLGAGPKEPLAPFTEQLRIKMQDVPRSPLPGRNPFAFAARSAPTPTRAARNVEATVAEAPPPAPVAVPRQRFELSGIASTARDGKSTLTAILLDNGSLIFAVVGEKLAGGYVVKDISEASVVITDPSGADQTVTLGPAKRP